VPGEQDNSVQGEGERKENRSNKQTGGVKGGKGRRSEYFQNNAGKKKGVGGTEKGCVEAEGRGGGGKSILFPDQTLPGKKLKKRPQEDQPWQGDLSISGRGERGTIQGYLKRKALRANPRWTRKTLTGKSLTGYRHQGSTEGTGNRERHGKKREGKVTSI